MFLSASPRGTPRVSPGKTNSMFPLRPVIKCLLHLFAIATYFHGSFPSKNRPGIPRSISVSGQLRTCPLLIITCWARGGVGTQLPSPVPELSFLPAPYRGWTRAGERRVQDNLHAHAQNEPIKNVSSKITKSQPRSRHCVAQCFFQLALWKKTFSLTLILLWFIVVCTLIDASLPFSLTFFSYCFCMLSDFANVFEKKVWLVQVAHLHNAARALSSPSRCFQLSTNLGKDSFRSLWYCHKKNKWNVV